MHQAGARVATPADRGNEPAAFQDRRPAWLSKPGFLAFGALRSYPLGQLRRLCAALQQRSLPLAAPSVLALVRQALYHLGQLQESNNGGLRLLWRTGWEQEGDVLPTLCEQLEQLAEELEQAPREHEQLLLLGEMAAFLSGWHPPCRAVARRFAVMSAAAAEQLEAQLAEVGEADARMAQQLQARQVQARGMALLCHASGEMSAADAAQMLRLMVRGLGLRLPTAKLRTLMQPRPA
jgi:hypothetical protein